MITFNEESEKVPTAIIELTKIYGSPHEEAISNLETKTDLTKNKAISLIEDDDGFCVDFSYTKKYI